MNLHLIFFSVSLLFIGGCTLTLIFLLGHIKIFSRYFNLNRDKFKRNLPTQDFEEKTRYHNLGLAMIPSLRSFFKLFMFFFIPFIGLNLYYSPFDPNLDEEIYWLILSVSTSSVFIVLKFFRYLVKRHGVIMYITNFNDYYKTY